MTIWPRTAGRLRLASAILCAVLALHVLITPLLYVGLDRIVVRTHSELFVAMAEGFAARRAHEFAQLKARPTTQDLEALADDILSSGLLDYVAVQWNGQSVRRSVANQPLPEAVEHDSFGVGDDQIYHITAPLHYGGEDGSLRLGFDEAPITAHIGEARRLIALALALYVAAVVCGALLLARFLSRPLAVLQQRSTRIAAGDLRQELRVGSGIVELDQLGESLDRMRAELVDVGAQLHRKQRLETVGTLAGGVAHEFNNILVPLTLFTESALKTLPAEHVARPWLTRAVAAAGRAREVVGKLLMFSGRGSQAALTPMRIAPAVEEALRLFARLRPSNIELDARVDAHADPVLAASGLIVQIVMNLCTNAYHAIPPTGGRIDVVLNNVEKDGRRFVELAVEDTGVGMDAETMRRIFEPFFTTRGIGEGTGLGLAVVHGLVQSMGASISVASTPGRGSRFHIHFPSVQTGD